LIFKSWSGRPSSNRHFELGNLAFSFNPVVITLAPYASLGMSLLFLPHKDVVYAFGVVDTQGLPNTAGFKTLVEDPTTLTNEVRVTVRPFGLTGHQLLGTAWANKPFTLLPQDRRTIIRNILLGTPLQTTSNNWAVYYNFDQYLYQDEHNPSRGFGIFFRAGVANPRTSPFRSSIVSVLAAKESSRGARGINSASAIIISNSATTFLLAFAS
jgi:porin